MTPAAGGLRRRLARARSGDLTSFERRESSQNGEDGVIEEVLRRIGAGGRRFAEFGIGPGVQGNCVRLADAEGWGGLFMEADEADHRALAAKYADRPAVRTRRELITPDHVVAVLRQEEVPDDLDVLSIDIDGNDLYVWQAIGEALRPRLVVVEYNASLGPDRVLVQPLSDAPWDATDYFGASIGALRRVAGELGYRLVHTDSQGVNAFFVAAELAGPFAPEDAVPLHGPAYALPPDPQRRPYVDLGRES